MNTNKTNIVLRLFAAMLFLAVSQSAFGQELIRENNNYQLCDTSIIRSKGNDTVLIYYRDSEQSVFMLVTNGMPYNVPTLKLHNLYVNDFEITKSGVYFCGYRIDEGRKKGIYGVFRMEPFANNPIYYYELDTCMELKKLDFYRVHEGMIYTDHEDHLVMTGTTTGARSDVLVDRIVYVIRPNPSYMPYTSMMYFSDNEDENFDDVAVTKNHVVVSVRKKVEGLPVVDFWQFNRPTSLDLSIFYSSFKHLLLGSPTPETAVFLEHVEDDIYAAVYKVEDYSTYSRMAMLQVDATNGNIKTVEILGDELLTNIPIDIKYKKSNGIFDILARRDYSYRDASDVYLPMQIYHVTPTVLYYPTSIGKGTRYPDNDVWSIDPTESSNFFVASGADRKFPRFFKYSPTNWEKCPEQFLYRAFVEETKRELKDMKLEWTGPKHDPIRVGPDPDEMPFEVKCSGK